MSTWNGHWPDAYSFQLHRLQFQHSVSAWFLSRADASYFEGFRGFPQSLQVEVSRRLSSLHHDRFLRNLSGSRIFSDSTNQLQ